MYTHSSCVCPCVKLLELWMRSQAVCVWVCGYVISLCTSALLHIQSSTCSQLPGNHLRLGWKCPSLACVSGNHERKNLTCGQASTQTWPLKRSREQEATGCPQEGCGHEERHTGQCYVDVKNGSQCGGRRRGMNGVGRIPDRAWLDHHRAKPRPQGRV